jgi:hypothetical protein
MPDLPSNTIARQQLEDFWRSELKKSYESYQAAAERYRSLLQAGHMQKEDATFALARREESAKLAEYMRMLKIFTDLALHGRVPRNGHRVSSAEGGQE